MFPGLDSDHREQQQANLEVVVRVSFSVEKLKVVQTWVNEGLKEQFIEPSIHIWITEELSFSCWHLLRWNNLVLECLSSVSSV